MAVVDSHFQLESIVGLTTGDASTWRLEAVANAEVEGRDRTDADDDRAVTDLVFGLTYRPIPQLAFKGNAILRSYGGDKDSDTLIDLGVGYSF